MKTAIIFLACSLASFASPAILSITAQGPTPLALRIQSEIGPGFDFQPGLIPTSITVAGQIWDQIPNPTLFSVGKGFNLDLSFLGKESGDINWFGLKLDQSEVWLYKPYSSDSVSQGYNISGSSFSSEAFSFVNKDITAHGMESDESDQVFFRFYQSESSQNDLLMLGDDGYRTHVDGDDFQFLIQRQVNVNEPANYALFLGVGVLGLILVRERLKKPAFDR